MTPEKIKEKISRTVQKITPDISEQIILDARKNAYKSKKEKAGVFSWKPALVFAMSCLLLVTMIVTRPPTKVAAATIALDVNPSIEVTLDDDGKVIEVVGKNEEGILVVKDIDFTGLTAEDALKVLVKALIKKGYLNDSANSILVTVDNEDITDSVLELMEKVLAVCDFQCSVLCQNLKNNPESTALAEKYAISIGKAQLITELIRLDDTYLIEDLVRLSVNELNLLLGNSENTVPGLKRMGRASEKEYIGEEEAKEIALASIGATEDEVSDYTYEIDYRHRNIVYVIKFVYNNTEYMVMVNGTSGTILECEQENKEYKYQYNSDGSKGPHNDNGSGNGSGNVNKGTGIGKENAKRIALSHANANEYRNYRSELCNQDGRLVYCIEFEADNRERKYVIDASTGEIIEDK
ncbi:MAG TPA: PepSY domain-containing protein [Erysipelotrichaceae bacterium]|nr:PepSY domain-containing protein [Erysipelotrichaceae bacterium]HQB31953.1 PepSY domain-containing protein [Erysipelotrichaceae bacterium]